MKQKLDKEMIGIVAFISFIILVTGLSLINFHMRKETSYTETAKCEVVDKYYRNGARGYCSYYLTLQFQGKYGEFEKNIHISEQAFYENVATGDVVSCEVVYDENGIIQLNIIEPDTIQVIDNNPTRNGFLIIVILISLVTLVFIIEALLKKSNKSR